MSKCPSPIPGVRDDVVKVARCRPVGVTPEQVGNDFGIRPMMLSTWLRQAASYHGDRPGVTTTESAELREARKRIRRLEQENEVHTFSLMPSVDKGGVLQ